MARTQPVARSASKAPQAAVSSLVTWRERPVPGSTRGGWGVPCGSPGDRARPVGGAGPF